MINYINEKASLKAFYKYPPELASFQKAMKDREDQQLNRKVLVDVFKKQYIQTGINNVEPLIEKLLVDNTYTVCTGHQLCLFTGPLYFIYKIITTINLAASLKKQYPENEFIPVYWMASEDHDFEEIQEVHLFGKNIKWKNTQAEGAVGKLKTDSLHSVIEEISKTLGKTEYSEELIDLFERAYLQQGNLADATRYLVHHLFKKHELLILDGDDPILKKEFIPFMQDDILNNTNHQLVHKNSEQLAALGFKVQVTPREINCFYLKGQSRERIVFKDTSYIVMNSSIRFSKEELIAELKKYPERFSPNVVTRPLYQQVILPNLAYVGGPGEIAYWLEYKSMFDHHQVNYPILIPRNFATLLDEKTMRNLSKLGLEAAAIFKEEEELIKELINKNTAANLSLQEKQEQMEALYLEISSLAENVDSTLKGSVEAEWKKVQSSLKNIENKMLRAEKQKQEVGINQLKTIKQKLFPEGVLQERYDNFSPYYMKTGEEFIGKLMEQFDPFDFKMNLLEI